MSRERIFGWGWLTLLFYLQHQSNKIIVQQIPSQSTNSEIQSFCQVGIKSQCGVQIGVQLQVNLLILQILQIIRSSRMIKGIIQKLIMSTFGKFIKGIQKDKLSVDLFGGNFKLENISLNHQYFNQLNTPFQLAYSSIGKLNLQAPLSKLSSVPVECVLDNIFVILQFKQGCGETIETIKGKKDKIFKEIGEALQTSLKKIKDDKKEDGMMARLGKKIIDNLQLKIMNVHIRFEEGSQFQNYAWGLTLEEISFTTTDENWKPCFIERTGQGKQKLFKMMQVKNLNFYWQSDLKSQSDLLKSQAFTDAIRKTRLSDLIKQQKNVVLSITSSFKLVINPPEDLQSPLYQIDISLEPLKFQFQRIQIGQMTDFARKNVMQNEMIVRTMNRKNKIKLSEEEKGRLRENYQEFINEVLQCHQNNRTVEDIEGYDQNLKEIFEKIQESELTLWELGPIKNKVKLIREIQLKKKKSGWFSKGSDLTLQQQQQLQKFIDQSFEAQKYRRQPSLLFFRFNIELKGGKMILVEFKSQDIQERIEFNIGKISSSISKSENQSFFQMDLDIESISMNLFVPIQRNNICRHRKMEIFTTEKPQYEESSDSQSMQSFDSVDEEQPEKISFLKLIYKNQLINKTVLKKTISGNMEKVTVIYKQLYMQKFKKFFSFKKTNIAKAANLEQYQHLTIEDEEEQQSFKLEKILDVKLDINSPMFICPLNENQCWCLHFGSLTVKSHRNGDFQEFPMVVNSAFLRYYPFIKQCYALKDSRMKQGIYSVINDMDFMINYQRYKDKNEEVFNVELPSFRVNFTQQQYENLMSLTKIFKVEEDQKRSMVQLLKEERKQIEENKTYEGFILKKQQTLMSWKIFHGILSGQYLYLYNDRKELRQNTKFYLKNAKVLLRNSEIQGDQEAREIELINQNQIWLLSSQNMAELDEWYLQLDKTCRSFKTIHELIKDYELSGQRTNKKRGNSETNLDLQINKKRKIVKINISEVQFRYNNNEEECLMEFQIKDIHFSRESMYEWSEKVFTMKQLLITDKIFKFRNPIYQKLIQAYEVNYHQLKGRKQKHGKRQSNIKLAVKDLFINWKPDVLLILMQLMNKHFKAEKNYRLDDDIEQSREQHFNQVYNDKKFMMNAEKYKQKGRGIFVKEKRDQLSLKSSWMKQTMKTELQMGRLEINMIHRESHLVMAKLESKDIQCLFSVCEGEKFLKGVMHTLDLYDMTGYPQKEYSPLEHYEPYRILTKAGDNDQPLIEFRWSMYNANDFPNEEHIDSFMWVDIAPLSYEYYQQVTFRLVDYLLIQVILLINQPEMLTVNENLMQQLRSSIKVQQKPIKVLFSQYQQVIKKLIHPTFMDMYFNLKKPIFIFKAEKHSHIYYKLTMEELTFFNTSSKNSTRFQKESKEIKELIFQERYIIKGKDCRFIQIVKKKQKEQELFQPFKIDIEFNKLLFEDQLNLLFPEVSNYDRSFITLNKISSINIPHYSRLQYLNINKLVNFNFTFDDQCDELFIHNFKVTKLLSPKPIVYQVVVPEIHMTADYNAKENTEDIWKLFKASLHNFNMEFRRNKQLDSSFIISIGLTEFKGYQYIEGEKEPKEHYLLSLAAEDIAKTGTDVIIQNKASGQKIIKMNVAEMNANVRTGLLQLIFEYTLVQDWVFPEVNKYVTQLIFCATVYSMNAELAQDVNYVISQLSKANKASNKLINDILEHKFDMAMFKLQGVLCYKFHRKRDETIQEYQKKLERKELTYADFDKKEAVTTMSVILNTEIYRAWTSSAAKRKILQKFTYTYEDKRYLRIADQSQCIIKTSAKRTMSIDHWLLKVSFKDLILMMKILNQIGEERKYIDYLNQKTGKNQGLNVALSKQLQSSSLQSLEINLQNLTFYLLNARRDIFIPILKIIISRCNFSKSNTFKKDILKGDLKLVIYYFNNLIFRWQPVLQKVSLFFHKLTYYQQNNRVFGSLESQGPIMINISREIFSSIKETVDAWKKQSQEQENKFIAQQREIQPLNFISHYIVRNQTGYPIEILNEKNILIKKLAHDEQMDYEFQIGDYDQQSQPEIFIGFRIIHPTYKFLAVKNISFSQEKQYEIHPVLLGGNNRIDSKIIIKPEIKDCKKIMMIKSSKYVYTYFDGDCQKKALPFDHENYYVLPKQIHNQLKVSLYEEKVTQHYRYVGQNGILKIMKKNLVYNYSPIPLQICGKIVRPNEYVGISEKLTIQGQSYRDSILKVVKNQKKKQYYIYAECYIIDYYGLIFQFQSKNKTIQKMYSHKGKENDYAYMVYILPEDQFKFKVTMGRDQATANLKTTIGKINFKLENKKAECLFTAYSYLSSIENQHINQFRRIVEITPQYMLSNGTKSLIKICQVQSCDSITLNPFERLPFFWENKTKPKMIKLALYDKVDYWGWSGDISIQKSTETIVLRKMSDPRQYRILTIQIEITNTVTFIHIVQPSPKYILKNSVPGTNLQVFQLAIMDEHLDHQHSFPKEFVFNVGYNEEKPFGYELPLQSHKIRVMVELDQTHPEFKGITCDYQTFEDMQVALQSKSVLLRNEKRRIVGKLCLMLCFENNIKKLKLQVEKDLQQEENTYQYLVKIPQIGISFIGNYKEIRKEIVHVIFGLIEVEFSGNADYSDMNLVVSTCRIENQLKYNAIFPVIFESVHTKQAKYFINFLVNRSAKNSRLIHYIGCSINKSWLTLTSEEVQILQENLNQVMLLNDSQKGHIRKIEMFNNTLPDPQESIFFVESVIHPLRSNITFKHVNEWGGRLLKTFSSINECPISTEGLKFKEFSCLNMNAYFSHLIKHYQDGIAKMVLPMIGNLTILGSPITFVQKIGSGFKDLVELPAEGFEVSALEGTKGVVRGAGSLIGQTISGAFNTVESITGSISNGITLLVDDDRQFSRERENIKNDRSQHVLGGLANGAKSIAYGFKNAFTGLFTQPVQGAEKNGLPGFLLGTAKGIGGLVIKPVSGVIDAASKTAEGIKNTPEFFSKQRKLRFTRQHNPRPFYNYYKQFRNYDNELAELIKILEQEDSDKFINLSWCSYYELTTKKQKSMPYLLLSYEYLFIYDIKRQKLVQNLKCQSFLSVSIVEDDKIAIKIRDRKSGKEGSLTVEPQSGCRKLAYEINTIIRHFKPNFMFV